MNYLEWNNIVTSHFFNTDNAGKNILLYATKQDIINFGKSQLSTKTDEEIWVDFIDAIKYDGQYDDDIRVPHSPISKPIELFDSWDKEETPPFITYLILYTIPLTETYKTHFNATTYYGRVNRFFEKNDILNAFVERKIGTSNFQNISYLWNELEEWSIMTKNCDLGIFELRKFGNPDWIHVYKPLSQCVFTPTSIEKLPDLFLTAGLVPDSNYSDQDLRKYLLQYGDAILGLSVNTIKLIRKSNDNELGQSIIEITKREYNKWNGESNVVGKETKLKSMLFPGRIYLQFKINTISDSIEFSYRTKFNQDYPENLKFNFSDISYEKNGFSQTIQLQYQQSFELIDEHNKWIAKFARKEVRLFHGAGNLQLSTNYWIETDEISRVDWMFLMCENDYVETITLWGENHCEKFSNASGTENLPDGYSLFKFLNPTQSHENIPLLTVNTTRAIKLNGGLRKTFRVFLEGFLPEVEIVNATGNEYVFLQYKNDNGEILLKQKNENGNRWILPSNIVLNFDFFIKLKDEEIGGFAQAYQICEPDYTKLSNDIVLIRNSFDLSAQTTNANLQGNNITLTNSINTAVDGQSFLPIEDAVIEDNLEFEYKENILLRWLVAIGQCNLQSFNEAFEIVHQKLFSDESLNLNLKRKASIYFLDNLGFIDYDYSSKKITTLPPKLILIPTKKGRKAMLIGGRDETLIKMIIDYCSKKENEISITIKMQDDKISQQLIPDSIILKCTSERELVFISKAVEIEFDKWYILKLKSFVPSLKNYEKFLLENNLSDSQEDHEWARQVFDLDTLRFTPQKKFSSTYALVEYTYTTYWKEYGLWIDGKYYKVDKNWGKYMVLNNYSEKERGYGRDVMFSKPREIYYNDNSLAIPAGLPLPRLMARILLQISGNLPEFKQIELNEKSRWYNVYQNLPSQFIDNFFRFKLNMNIERTTLKM